MNRIVRFSIVDRRVLLASLALLPALSASLRSRAPVAQAQSDPLPSWNEGATKASIIDFVARVTAQGGPFFVPVEQRIATFDNDGTLWIEQPMTTVSRISVNSTSPWMPPRRTGGPWST